MKVIETGILLADVRMTAKSIPKHHFQAVYFRSTRW